MLSSFRLVIFGPWSCKVPCRNLDTAVADHPSYGGGVASSREDIDAWPAIPSSTLRSPCTGSASARAPDRSPPLAPARRGALLAVRARAGAGRIADAALLPSGPAS